MPRIVAHERNELDLEQKGMGWFLKLLSHLYALFGSTSREPGHTVSEHVHALLPTFESFFDTLLRIRLMMSRFPLSYKVPYRHMQNLYFPSVSATEFSTERWQDSLLTKCTNIADAIKAFTLAP